VWFWLTMAGGALITAGGALVTARGRSWPAARRAYDRTYDRQESRPTGRADAWTALDRGEDPTL
jgi:hypothetical protein